MPAQRLPQVETERSALLLLLLLLPTPMPPLNDCTGYDVGCEDGVLLLDEEEEEEEEEEEGGSWSCLTWSSDGSLSVQVPPPLPAATVIVVT